MLYECKRFYPKRVFVVVLQWLWEWSCKATNELTWLADWNEWGAGPGYVIRMHTQTTTKTIVLHFLPFTTLVSCTIQGQTWYVEQCQSPEQLAYLGSFMCVDLSLILCIAKLHTVHVHCTDLKWFHQNIIVNVVCMVLLRSERAKRAHSLSLY